MSRSHGYSSSRRVRDAGDDLLQRDARSTRDPSSLDAQRKGFYHTWLFNILLNEPQLMDLLTFNHLVPVTDPQVSEVPDRPRALQEGPNFQRRQTLR